MTYVDGYVLTVPKDKKDAYKDTCLKTAEVFKAHGALRCVECWGDDVPDGQLTSFPMAVKAEPDEVVVFSWVVWPSRETREAGAKAAMEDPRMESIDFSMVDGKRMIFGSFEPLIDV